MILWKNCYNLFQHKIICGSNWIFVQKDLLQITHFLNIPIKNKKMNRNLWKFRYKLLLNNITVQWSNVGSLCQTPQSFRIDEVVGSMFYLPGCCLHYSSAVVVQLQLVPLHLQQPLADVGSKFLTYLPNVGFRGLQHLNHERSSVLLYSVQCVPCVTSTPYWMVSISKIWQLQARSIWCTEYIQESRVKYLPSK